VTAFPPGLQPPRKVRLYWRHDHYLLQWWSPAQGKNVSERVTGDLLAALVRARTIDERLQNFPRPAAPTGRCGHAAVVEGFLDHLRRRAEAGEVQPATVARYRTALGHYLAFVDQDSVRKGYRHAHQVDPDFRLSFAAFLANRRVTPNGRPGAEAGPMKGPAFVLDAVRAMLEWAADPDRGNLLPEGFRSPFRRQGGSRPVLVGDPLNEPDITVEMTVAFVGACDRYQLLLFVPLLVFGLRASEPCFLFREYLDGGWLRVPCNPDLGYQTKGRRDKRFPVVESLQPFWDELRAGAGQGLLYLRRRVYEGQEPAPLQGASLGELVAEFRCRGAAVQSLDAAGRLRLRDAILREAGGVCYNQVQGEFEGLARKLGWPAGATLKDFRHLFCTMLGNAAMPEGYRRYLMGHAPGKAAAVAYTHLNQLREQFAAVVRREWLPLVEAVNRRVRKL
jgi:integrase